MMIEIDRKAIEKVILKAGELLTGFQARLDRLVIENKPLEGLVSNADREVEKYIIEKVSHLYPDSEFIAEEDSFKNKEKKIKNNKLHWLIDPLDGTNNFLSNFDYFSISIAAYYQNEVIRGWVFRPSTKEMFYSEKGGGSFYQKQDSKRVRVFIKNTSLHSSMLTTGFCVEKGQKFDEEFELFKKVMGQCRGIRRLGSAALDLCYSANGPWNGFWERGLSPWDVAAGALYVLESGGIVTNYKGAKFSPFDSSIVAASKLAHSDLLKLIGKK